jgi:hypothetical protein
VGDNPCPPQPPPASDIYLASLILRVSALSMGASLRSFCGGRPQAWLPRFAHFAGVGPKHMLFASLILRGSSLSICYSLRSFCGVCASLRSICYSLRSFCEPLAIILTPSTYILYTFFICIYF